jgi:hypothetical protein
MSNLFVRHKAPLAIMTSAYRGPDQKSALEVPVEMGSPDPAVSTGLLHQEKLGERQGVGVTIRDKIFQD